MAAFVVVLAIAGLYVLLSDDRPEVAEPTPPLTDIEVIEAGVGALYSGDAKRAVELFELTTFGPSDDWIRDEVTYQAALEGQTTMDCFERDTPGVFTCTWLYHNSIGDVIGYVESSRDIVRVDVQDGLIVQFGQFPFTGAGDDPLIGDLRSFLNQVGDSRDHGDSTCSFHWPFPLRGDGSRFTPECLDFVMEHLDDWASWYEANQ